MDRETTLSHLKNLQNGDVFCLNIGKYRLRMVYFLGRMDGVPTFYDGVDYSFFKMTDKVIEKICTIKWEDDEKFPPLDYVETLPQNIFDSLRDALSMVEGMTIEERNPFEN